MNCDEHVVKIDGSILEGGGQILRNCTTYSAITGKEIFIQKIRGNRDKPGLKNQHYAGISAAQKLTSASCVGLELGSTQLIFKPEKITPHSFKVDVGTAGAISLVIQTILPILLYAKDENSYAIEITGGTNVDMSPHIDFSIHILLPVLKKMGVEAQIDIGKRGYMPKGGGSVTLNVQPLKFGTSLFPINITEPGKIVAINAFLHGYAGKSTIDKISEELKKELPECAIDLSHCKINAQDSGNAIGLFIVGQTDNDIPTFSSEMLYQSAKKIKKNALGHTDFTISRMVKCAIGQFKRNSRFAINEYLQDQLILFMAIAKGISKIHTGEITLHTKTAIHFAEIFTEARFFIQNVPENGGNFIICVSPGLQNMP